MKKSIFITSLSLIFILQIALCGCKKENINGDAKYKALKITMDTLWSNYALLNRNVMLSIIDSTYGITESVFLLNKNQENIGKVFIPYYSDAGAKALSTLLRNHVNTTLNLFYLSKTKSTPAYTDALTVWYSSGESIASFFYANNPGWSMAIWKEIMKKHLDSVSESTAALYNGDKAKELEAYHRSKAELMLMSGMLSEGMRQSCPEQF